MEGYPKLARWMSRHPEIAIFRSFEELHMLSLLHQQAELVHLEADFQRIASANRNSDDSRKHAYDRNWWALSRCAEDGSDLQLQITKKVQEKLKAYYEAISLQSALRNLEKPRDQDVKFLRNWLDDPRKGKSFLEDLERDTWEEDKEFELVSLHKPCVENDPLSRWIKGKFLRWYHRRIGYRYKRPVSFDPESGAANYDDKVIQNVVYVASLIIFCSVVILPMVILHLLSSLWARLSVVAFFIVFFTFVMAIYTTGPRRDKMVAIATYAAVQIVFVGSTQGASTQ